MSSLSARSPFDEEKEYVRNHEAFTSLMNSQQAEHTDLTKDRQIELLRAEAQSLRNQLSHKERRLAHKLKEEEVFSQQTSDVFRTLRATLIETQKKLPEKKKNKKRAFDQRDTSIQALVNAQAANQSLMEDNNVLNDMLEDRKSDLLRGAQHLKYLSRELERLQTNSAAQAAMRQDLAKTLKKVFDNNFELQMQVIDLEDQMNHKVRQQEELVSIINRLSAENAGLRSKWGAAEAHVALLKLNSPETTRANVKKETQQDGNKTYSSNPVSRFSRR